MDAVTRLKTCSAGGSVAGGKFSPNSSSPTCITIVKDMRHGVVYCIARHLHAAVQ